MSIDVNYQYFAHISQESWRRCFNWNIYCLTEKWLLSYSPKTSTQRYEKWQMHFPNAFKLFILLSIYSHFLQVSKYLRTSRLWEIDAHSRISYNWTLALIELSEFCMWCISQGKSWEPSLNYLGVCWFYDVAYLANMRKPEHCYDFCCRSPENKQCQETEGINIDIKITRPIQSCAILCDWLLLSAIYNPTICGNWDARQTIILFLHN